MKAPIEQLKPFTNYPMVVNRGYNHRKKLYGKLPKGWRYRNVGDKPQEGDVLGDYGPHGFVHLPSCEDKIGDWSCLVVYYAPKKRPYRVLKVKKVGEDNRNVEYKIVAQSHRNENFAPRLGVSAYMFIAKNGIRLGSGARPANYGGNNFYVRGDRLERDGDAIVFRKDMEQKFLDAVKEYNEFYAEAPKAAPATVAPPAPKVEVKKETAPEFKRVEWKEYSNDNVTIFYIISVPAPIEMFSGGLTSGKMIVKEGSHSIEVFRAALEEINSILP